MSHIHAGNFHRLSSAGQPLSERSPSIDVPLTFEPSSPGPVMHSQPQLPGRLSTNNIRETGADFRAPMYPAPCVRSVVFVSSTISDAPSRTSEPSVRTSSRHAEEEDVALETKYPAHGGDAQQEYTSIEHVKRRHRKSSRVTSARPARHGDDTKPVIVTSLNMTQGYVAMTYPNNDANLGSGFTTPAPMVGSPSTPVWGAPYTGGLVHMNYIPQQYYLPPTTPTVIVLPSCPAPYPQTHVQYTAPPVFILPPPVCPRGGNTYIPPCPRCHRSM